MSWRIKSLLISIAANLIFLAAAWFWIIFPLMLGVVPALEVCKLFDPGNQPYVAACSGWHGTAADMLGVILNIALDWGVIWAAGASFHSLSKRANVAPKGLQSEPSVPLW
jgi:hypothetical protein